MTCWESASLETLMGMWDCCIRLNFSKESYLFVEKSISLYEEQKLEAFADGRQAGAANVM